MTEPETPLILSFFVRIRRLIVALAALAWLAALSVFLAVVISAVSAGSLFIWHVVHSVNRRDDPRYITPPSPGPGGASGTDTVAG